MAQASPPGSRDANTAHAQPLSLGFMGSNGGAEEALD